ncbi:hypothetical protein BpHYR1_009836 [Brachionus plicatilis]|uniref:Uncharacterized protein n=1 Tax=Brachionus plicatilis TaxID=10195 RepID=A0A3M7PHZ2_BRAPC|nr:hypothetical protein BpHYR1_009836 [Brachionus plicatilis]
MGRRSSPFHVPFFEQRLRPDTEVTASSWSSAPLLLPSRNRSPASKVKIIFSNFLENNFFITFAYSNIQHVFCII